MATNTEKFDMKLRDDQRLYPMLKIGWCKTLFSKHSLRRLLL